MPKTLDLDDETSDALESSRKLAWQKRVLKNMKKSGDFKPL